MILRIDLSISITAQNVAREWTEIKTMNRNVICDKCGHEFAITLDNCGEIQKDDIIVQYFYCTECNNKYHVCTTTPKMRKLIDHRAEIQRRIAIRSKNGLPKTAQKLQYELERIIVRQKELMPDLRKQGEEILNEISKCIDEKAEPEG